MRSNLINDIRQQVEDEGKGAYSAIGVSKLVFPIDDLFAYFANQKVVESLITTWVVLDDIYKKAWVNYKNKLNAGEKATEPIKGDIFIQNVQQFAKKVTGIQKTIFNNIYTSTWVLDEEMVPVRTKYSDYISAVEKHVEEVIDSNDKFKKLYENSVAGMDSFLTEDDETNDVESISEREENLERSTEILTSS